MGRSYSNSTAVLAAAVRVEDEALQRALAQFLVVMNRDLSDVLKQQARLLVLALIKLTPPFISRAARGESWSAQRQIGAAAIERQIRYVFKPLSDISVISDPKNKELGKALKGALLHNAGIVARGKKKGSPLPELLARANLPADLPSRILAAPNPYYHRERRNRRGRVTPQKNPYYVSRPSAISAYVRRVQEGRQGTLKGGWAAGAAQFGVSLPAWIASHKSGEATDQSFRAVNPFVSVANSVSYMSHHNSSLRIVLYALQDRREALLRQANAVIAKQTQKMAA